VADDKGAEAIRDKNRRIREEAAQKRRTKREGEKAAARRPTLGQLEASEIMDDAFARTTHAVTGWVRKHFAIVQWVLVGSLASVIGWQVFKYHRGKVEGRTTDALAAGLTEELARVGDEPATEDQFTGLGDPRPLHATNEQRLKAAEAAYRKVSDGDSIRTLARLGLAGVLLDQDKYKEALVEYRAVKDSPLSQKDADVRARSIEGVGLSQEGAGDSAGALKTFHELANQDSAAVSALGLYHQARIEKKQGGIEKAKGYLVSALKKISDSKLRQAYVEGVARELLGSIDPKALPPPSPQMLSAEQREQLAALEKMKKAAQEATKAAQEATKDSPKDVSPEQFKKLIDDLNKKVPPAPAPSGKAP
jgi:hypothetical protein